MPPTTHTNSRHRLAHRAAGALATAATMGLIGLGLSAPSALAADNCANAAVRAQNNSTALPDCRAYEMVSSPYKEGFSIFTGGFTDDGVVSYQSRGSFAGDEHGSSNNLYHGVRSAAGWMTTPLGPPATVYNTSKGNDTALTVAAETPDLRWSLWAMSRRADAVPRFNYWLRGPDGAFAQIGDTGGLGVRGFSSDLSHLVASLGVAGSVPQTDLFEFVGTNNEGPPRSVNVDNTGGRTPGETCLGDVSSDGRVIVFASGCNGTALSQVWARVGGTTTVAVSGSECTRSAGDAGGLCNAVSAANYQGGAADGSRLFFTTKQQLVNGDIDTADDADVEAGTDLYACDVPAGVPAPVGSANGCSTLTEVSGAADEDAQVENVVAISGDGSRVYFVAQGVLADNLDVRGVGPLAGAANLYLWERDDAHPDGQTRYVARLGGSDLGRAQMTPDGRYLLFTTASALVTGGPGADTTDSARDVYRYDAVTHAIVRVSTAVAGGGGNGSFDASIPEKSAMSADGSTVVFNSAEALSLSDTNGVTDAYSWHDGQVAAISASGGGAMGITASGRDIFLVSSAPVLAADRDRVNDIYTARVGGGFKPPQTPPSCSVDQCQGLLSAPLVLGAPGSGGLGGNADGGVRPAIGGIARLSAADRAALAKGGKARLRLSVNRPGTVTVAGKARLGTKSRRVVSSSAKARKAGKVSVRFALSRSARRELAHRGSLTVGLTVGFKDARPKTLTVTLTKPKFGRGGSR